MRCDREKLAKPARQARELVSKLEPGFALPQFRMRRGNLSRGPGDQSDALTLACNACDGPYDFYGQVGQWPVVWQLIACSRFCNHYTTGFF